MVGIEEFVGLKENYFFFVIFSILGREMRVLIFILYDYEGDKRFESVRFNIELYFFDKCLNE